MTLGVNYRTAWFINHRIREAMQSEAGLFGGEVVIDETYIGGNYDPRRKRAKRDNPAVMGMIQRGNPSQVQASVIPKVSHPVVDQPSKSASRSRPISTPRSTLPIAT